MWDEDDLGVIELDGGWGGPALRPRRCAARRDEDRADGESQRWEGDPAAAGALTLALSHEGRGS